MCCAERKRREQEARQTKFYALVFGIFVLLVISFVYGARYLASWMG